MLDYRIVMESKAGFFDRGSIFLRTTWWKLRDENFGFFVDQVCLVVFMAPTRWWVPEIRLVNSPVEVGSLSVYPVIYKLLAPSQVVVWDFFHQQKELIFQPKKKGSKMSSLVQNDNSPEV